MKKQNINRKRILTILCAFLIFASSLNIWNCNRTSSAVDTTEAVVPVYLPGFKNVTLSNFGMADEKYDNAYDLQWHELTDLQGNSVNNLNKTMLSMNVDFDKQETSHTLQLFVASTGKTSTGVRITTSSSGGSLYLSGDGGKFWQQIKAVDHLPAGVDATGYFDKEMILQLSFEFVAVDADNIKDDLRIGLYVNGQVFKNANAQNDGTWLYKNCEPSSVLGGKIATYTGSSLGIQMSSIIPKNDSLTEVTWSDFSETQTFEYAAPEEFLQTETSGECYAYKLNSQDISQMSGTSLRVKITLNGSGLYGSRIHFAGTKQWYGIPFGVYDNNEELAIWDLNETPNLEGKGNRAYIAKFKKDVANVDTFLKQEFTIRLTTEFGDYDGDGDEEDVQLGFYFGEELYNKQYLYGYDCKQDFGNYVTIYTYGGSVEIRPVIVGEPEHIAYDLTDYAYPLGTDEVWVNGEKVATNSKLNEPGDYNIAVGDKESIVKNVVTYFAGDSNKSSDVDVKDLVAALKIKNNDIAIQANTPEFYATDMDASGTVTSEDIGEIRALLIREVEQSNAVSFDIIGGKDVMPIGGGTYRPLESNNAEELDALYGTLKAAGINLITYTERDYNRYQPAVERFLELGNKYGIGLLVNDSFITGRSGASYVSSARLGNQIAKYANHPAFCGLYLVDEPGTDVYQPRKIVSVARYGELARDLQYDLGYHCYMNMYPMYNVADVSEDVRKANYEAYVKEFCETFQPKILTWDNYPFPNKEWNLYFYNMSLMRQYAIEYNVPFWAHIQAGGQWPDNQKTEYYESVALYPNESQFQWNVNTCLAFGVQGIQYFPLTQPESFAKALDTDGNQTMDYRRSGLIGADGNPNQWYGYAQTINTHIAAIDEVLMNAVHKGMIVNAAEEGTRGSFLNESEVHSVLDDVKDCVNNTLLADGIDTEYTYGFFGESSVNDKKAAEYEEIADVNGEAMIGYFDYKGKTALYVVNYNMESAKTITINFDKAYQMKIIQNAQQSDTNKQSLPLNMAAGEGVLIVLES